MRNFAPQMEKDMQSYRLSDLVKIKNGKDHKMLSNGKYPVLGSGGIMRYVDKFLYDKPSVLLPRKGTLDNIQYCDMPFWTVDTLYYTEVNTNLANPYYLYRYLSLLDLSNLDSGTGVPSMTFDNYYGLKIFLPNIERQTKIAQILQTLDKKITINRQINQNLEAMAKQLYDYWFVQFDFPNEEGKPYKSSGGEMVWNEKLKRMIPKEWTNANIYQLASISKETVNPLARPNELFKHYSLPEYDKTGTYAEEYGIDIQSAKFTVTNNCILVSKLNPWTSRVICGNRESNQICSTEFVVWNPASMKTKGFLFMLAKSAKFIEYCTQGATGTSHSHRRINPELMMKFDFSYNSEIAIKFSRLIENIIGKLHDNIAQLKILTKQRDELLPLLMNGQITIE